MCILATTPSAVVSNPAAATCPAKLLGPPERQALAVEALAGARPVSQLAADYQVSRKFVYQQAERAEQALTEAFDPEPPADGPVLFYLPVTELWLRRLIVALLLICHSSYRGVYELLRDLFHCRRSLGYVHNVAHAAMARAHVHNDRQHLSGVRQGAHDELYQASDPVLVGVDVASTYCYLLSLEAQCDADTWGVRLLELQAHSFAPEAIICDAGSALQAGQALALPGTPRRGDVFHVLHEISPVVRCLENRAYQALETCVKLQRKQAQYEQQHGHRDRSLSAKLRSAEPAAERAVALAEDVATVGKWLRQDVLAVAGPDYATRCALYDFLVGELRARVGHGPQGLRTLCTYLVNQRDAVLAFAQQLDRDLEALAADFQVAESVVRAVLYTQQQNPHDPRRWRAEAALRQQLRGRFYELSQAVAALAQQTVRASSVVENVNSRLRNYFFLRRHLGADYLHLLQFFLNHRRFLRSEHAERVDHSPAELLTGQPHAHWLELLGLPDPLAN